LDEKYYLFPSVFALMCVQYLSYILLVTSKQNLKIGHVFICS
jgi:hypothetical protein